MTTSSNQRKLITIASGKGGVGKTTTAVNLAAGLAHAHGKRVLVVDMDPQGNATMGSGVDKRTLQRTVYHVLLEQSTVSEARAACCILCVTMRIVYWPRSCCIKSSILIVAIGSRGLMVKEVLRVEAI